MSADSPPPTAHDAEDLLPGPDLAELDRRTFMKTTAAGAIAAAGIGAGSTSVAADDDVAWYDHGLTYSPDSPDVSDLLFSGSSGDAPVNEDPNPDEVALHSTATNAHAWWDEIVDILVSNRLEDGVMAAHVAARAAISDSHEDGLNSSEAIDEVYDAIEDFYSTPAINVTNSMAMVLSQQMHVSKVARESEEIDDRFLAFTIANDNYTGDASMVPEGSYLDTEFSDTSIELPNGDSYDVQAPLFHQEWDNGDTLSFTISDRTLDAYDDQLEAFEFSTADNETAETNGRLTVQSVGDADLESRIVGVLAEWADWIEEIEALVSETKGNYDLDLIDEIYDALDSGEISHSDVRGIEGLAEHLSGSTDPTQSRYQMALLNSLGLNRNELADVASMTVEYTGFTGRTIHRDDNGAIDSVERTGYDSTVIEGQVFGDLVDDTTLSPGDSYAINHRWYAINSDDEVLSLTNDLSTIEKWSPPDNPYQISLPTDGSYVAVGHLSGATIYTNHGEEIAHADQSEAADEVIAHPDDDIWFAGSRNDEVVCYDLDGNSQWAYSVSDTPESLSIHPDGDRIAVVSGSGDVYSINMDGNSEWETGIAGSTDFGLDWHPSGDYLVVGNDEDEFIKIEAETGDIIDETDHGNGRTMELHWSSDGERIAVPHESPDLFAVYDADLNEVWTEAVDNTGESAAWTPDGQRVIFTNNFHAALYTRDGDHILTNDDIDSVAQTRFQHSRVDGMIDRAMGFDAPSGDSIDMIDGLLDVIELTDRDGNELEDDYEAEWDRPQYEETDITEYQEYVTHVSTEHAEAVAAEEEDDDGDVEVGFGWPSLTDFDADGMLGLGIVAGAVLLVVGVVTDLIPVLGD